MTELNPRQLAFCNEYAKDCNATQAYIRAGYSAKGAEVSASQLLTNPKVKKKCLNC
jgi:phage terminase small subunit